jgi:hypothetical protein
MSYLLELHPGISFLIICAITVIIAITGLRFVRKRFEQESLAENHEVAAIIFNAFGILYAVVIAFVVFVVWGRYDDAGKNLELEASQAADIFYVSRAFPDSTAKQIRQSLYEYSLSVCDNELKENGKSSPKTIEAVSKLMRIFLAMDSKNISNPTVYEESFKRFNDLAQYRRLRVFAAKDSVPLVIWIVLLTGAVIMVSYTYFFAIKRILPQNIMTAALTITLTLILFLIYMLDHPFTGASGIGDVPMRTVMEQMKRSIDNQNKNQNQIQNQSKDTIQNQNQNQNPGQK